MAQVRGTSRDEMAKITSDNFFRLFSKVPRPVRFA
jgi:Tat protein secretion system quality control protein TatD with DNase activity